jgi:hypothetical protein
VILTADIVAAIGSSGTGKGQFVKERLTKRGRRRVLVWSVLEATDQYAAFLGGQVVASIPDLVTAVKGKAKAVVYTPHGRVKLADQFNLFCRVAWECKGWVVVVEELSRVTRASYAPPAWQQLSTAGRHQGLTLIGTSQRPSQIDKDFLGNCTEIRCYRLNYEDDARAMSSVMREPWEAFMDLPDLHYRHRIIRDRKNVAGVQKIMA